MGGSCRSVCHIFVVHVISRDYSIVGFSFIVNVMGRVVSDIYAGGFGM